MYNNALFLRYRSLHLSACIIIVLAVITMHCRTSAFQVPVPLFEEKLTAVSWISVFASCCKRLFLYMNHSALLMLQCSMVSRA
jgi:hypothetical protein